MFMSKSIVQCFMHVTLIVEVYCIFIFQYPVETTNYSKALDWIEEGIFMVARDGKLKSEFYLLKSYAYLHLNKESKARETFSKVNEDTLGPDHGFFQELRGDLLAAEKRWEEAKNAWNLALDYGGRESRLEKKIKGAEGK